MQRDIGLRGYGGRAIEHRGERVRSSRRTRDVRIERSAESRVRARNGFRTGRGLGSPRGVWRDFFGRSRQFNRLVRTNGRSAGGGHLARRRRHCPRRTQGFRCRNLPQLHERGKRWAQPRGRRKLRTRLIRSLAARGLPQLGRLRRLERRARRARWFLIRHDSRKRRETRMVMHGQPQQGQR